MKKLRALGPLIFLAVFAAATVIVMLLWNSVAVYLFGVPEVDFWYAAGLILLSKLLLGGFRGMHGWHGGHGFHGRCRDAKGKRGKFDRHVEMVHRMHERFHAMDENERREHIRRHMAHWPGCCDMKDAPQEETPAGETKGNE